MPTVRVNADANTVIAWQVDGVKAQTTAIGGAALPVEAGGIRLLLQALWTDAPSSVAVGEGGPIVGPAPDEQAARGALPGTLHRHPFILQALAHNVRKTVSQRLEYRPELTCLRPRQRQRDTDCEQNCKDDSRRSKSGHDPSSMHTHHI